MSVDNFIKRHIGPNEEETNQMLKTIGVKQLDELIDKIVPSSIRLKNPLNIADGMTEFDFLMSLNEIAAKNKIFKTARIDKVDVTNIPYQFEEFHKQMPVDVFRISGENQIYVKLKLKLRAYNLLIEEYPLSEKFINQNDDTTYTFSANVCGFEGVGRFVAGLTNEIQIIEPVELIEFIKEKFKKFSN